MTQLDTTPASTHQETSSSLPRWAGGFALAHVVLLFAGFSQEVVVAHGTSLADLQDKYGGAAMNRVLAGGYVEALAFVVLVPALVLLARLFGRRTETGRVASQTFLGLGLVYAASTLAVGFAPGAAAVYAAHHHVPITTIATVNDIRNYSFVLQVATGLAMVLALSIAALAERTHVRWGWAGVAVGGLGLAITPFAHNATDMVRMLWWVGLAVLCLRDAGGRRTR
ncbi:MAG: hypothetical protein J7518_20855 [Nocardioidaceae bacterium]|nr:hypothetical protein [Nocardioidaceae bacterium]